MGKIVEALSCLNCGSNDLPYENGFLAFTDDFCDYARGLTLQVIDWYRDKWSLFLRGFNRGQLNLFETKGEQ